MILRLNSMASWKSPWSTGNERATNDLQKQRNQAMDTAVAQEMRAARAEELAKAQARIKELELKSTEPKN